MEVWSDLLSETDREVIKLGSYGNTRGMGERPTLLIIDAQRNYIGLDEPISESMRTWPSSCGERAYRAVENCLDVVTAARRHDTPVIYSRQVQKRTVQFDAFQSKVTRNPQNYVDGGPGTEIVPEAGVEDGDVVIDKSYASLFFGTPLVSYLFKLRVDSLLIMGGSTSGCVRATAIDAVTRNLNVAIVEDAVYDRIEASHKVALLDFWMKYGDLMQSMDAVAYLDGLKG